MSEVEQFEHTMALFTPKVIGFGATVHSLQILKL
jgi:hypothetical protein